MWRENLTESDAWHLFPKVDNMGKRYNTRTPAWCSRSMGERPNLCYSFHGISPHPSGWRLSRERMNEEYAKGNIVIVGGKLERRSYERDYKGVSPGNLWADTDLLLGSQSPERVGYPTQKPLALLERIIRASSNVDDVILDPFCGCATACVAAEKAERQWVGIDLSPKALELVQLRLGKELGYFGREFTIHRVDIPRRTDIGKQPHYRTQKHTLFGKQEGICNGCQATFPFRNFTVDHIVPSSHGGTSHIDNLQLLCGACNSSKGNRPHAELIADLQRQGIIS